MKVGTQALDSPIAAVDKYSTCATNHSPLALLNGYSAEVIKVCNEALKGGVGEINWKAQPDVRSTAPSQSRNGIW